MARIANYDLKSAALVCADARLSAAAPEMLAACELALDNLGAEARTRTAAETFAALNAAIAKARGE